jgi:DNA-binding PadR family transcriptional regulator
MEPKNPLLTPQTLKVMVALLEQPREELSGAQIRLSTNLKSGTLYPILLRLEDAKWLQSRWEIENPQALGRPRRRYYRLTALGYAQGHRAVDDIRESFGRLAWA